VTTLRARLIGVAVLAAGLPLAVLLLSGVVMLKMREDVVVVAIAAASSAVGLAAALLVARSVNRSIDELRAASADLAAGELSARAPERGPAELAELGAAFNEMAGRLEDLFDARRELVVWASHDLRTPLASLQAMLEALEDGLGEPERYVVSMREQVELLARLVNDLFELAKIDAGALTIELREAALSGVVESCLRGLEVEAERRSVRLESRVDAGLPPVLCAPEHVERVLVNLVSNALRHTPSDGSVAVRVERAAADVRVSVEDTGEGLAPEALRRMFDRFWRGDEARTTGRGGAGLGLAISRALVEAQGGRIWAENRSGGGARFAFTLPVAPAP
jgi:two-component system, OmpR family, sensor histidine kinase SaeS